MVSIGIQLCEEIDLYGFWPFPIDHKGNAVLYHYTDDFKWSNDRGRHSYSIEFSHLTKMHKEGITRLHIGKCA